MRLLTISTARQKSTIKLNKPPIRQNSITHLMNSNRRKNSPQIKSNTNTMKGRTIDTIAPLSPTTNPTNKITINTTHNSSTSINPNNRKSKNSTNMGQKNNTTTLTSSNPTNPNSTNTESKNP